MGKMVNAKAIDGPLRGETLCVPEGGRWEHVVPTSDRSMGAPRFDVWTYVPHKVNEWLWVAAVSHLSSYRFDEKCPVVFCSKEARLPAAE